MSLIVDERPLAKESFISFANADCAILFKVLVKFRLAANVFFALPARSPGLGTAPFGGVHRSIVSKWLCVWSRPVEAPIGHSRTTYEYPSRMAYPSLSASNGEVLAVVLCGLVAQDGTSHVLELSAMAQPWPVQDPLATLLVLAPCSAHRRHYHNCIVGIQLLDTDTVHALKTKQYVCALPLLCVKFAMCLRGVQ